MEEKQVKRVPEIMLADDPMEKREQIMRDSCDQIVEKFYTRKFSSEEVQGKRAEYCEVGMKKSALEKELREVSADLKGKIKPLKERMPSWMRSNRVVSKSRVTRSSSFLKRSVRLVSMTPTATWLKSVI